jgi:hypothetical protein
LRFLFHLNGDDRRLGHQACHEDVSVTTPSITVSDLQDARTFLTNCLPMRDTRVGRQIEAGTGDPGPKSLYSPGLLSPKNFMSFIVNPRLDLAQGGEQHDGAVAFAQALLGELQPCMSGDEVAKLVACNDKRHGPDCPNAAGRWSVAAVP